MLRHLKSRPPTEDGSDRELLERFRQTSAPDDLLPLFEKYAGLIYALGLRYLGSPERAEDAGMEIWSVLLEKLPRHEVSNFRSWLQTTVRNHCLMQLRREKRDPLRQPEVGVVQSNRLLHLKDETDPENHPDTRSLHGCLKQLKAEQRRCIQLFYLQEGESYQSIAESLDLTVGMVRSHLQNGRRNLRNCLEQQNYPE